MGLKNDVELALLGVTRRTGPIRNARIIDTQQFRSRDFLLSFIDFTFRGLLALFIDLI